MSYGSIFNLAPVNAEPDYYSTNLNLVSLWVKAQIPKKNKEDVFSVVQWNDCKVAIWMTSETTKDGRLAPIIEALLPPWRLLL